MAIKFEFNNGDYYIDGVKFHDKLELTFEQRMLFTQFQEALMKGLKIKSVIYKTKDNDNTKSNDPESEVD